MSVSRNNKKTIAPNSSFAETLLSLIEEFAKESKNKTAIVTFNSFSTGWIQPFDVIAQEEKKEGIWGHQDFYRLVLKAKFVNPEIYPLAIVVRTFSQKTFVSLDKKRKKSIVPGKQIRMFFVKAPGQVEQLSAEECFSCMNTDSETGGILPLDPTLEYVGVKQ